MGRGKCILSSSMARKAEPPSRPGLPAEETALWQRAMADAKPLRPRKPQSKEAPAVADKKAAEDKGAARRAAAATPLPVVPPAVAHLDASRRSVIPGLDRRAADRLRQGRRPIEGRLDLHGMTQEAAHAALRRFIAAALRDEKRCVLVITGKGATRQDETDTIMPSRRGGVLREAVPRWLAEPSLRSHVVALHPAAAQHGGDGALYVLLRRRRAGGAAPS